MQPVPALQLLDNDVRRERRLDRRGHRLVQLRIEWLADRVYRDEPS
jgi:hypothetical protein